MSSKTNLTAKNIEIGQFKFVLQIKNNLSLHGCGLFGSFNRIASGKDTIEGMYPFIALLYRLSVPYGGAVIINDRWLLTAAHNFHSSINGSMYSIGVGSIHINRLLVREIDKIILHEKYQHRQKYDLAMIKLKESLRFGKTIRPICLPDYPFEPMNLNKGRVIGWGYRNFNSTKVSMVLQEVDLDILPLKDCRRIYSIIKQDIIRSQICTHTIHKDACRGDSGGPFFVYKNNRAILFGIVSFGVTCADKFPGVYTAVSFYLNWIDRILQEN